MKALKNVLLFFVSVLLFSCHILDDETETDKVEIVTLYVSSETGYYCTFGNCPDKAYEGMQFKEKGHNEWSCNSFQYIAGFVYERGYEYELSVKKTTLANPPQDSSNIVYELINVLSKIKVE